MSPSNAPDITKLQPLLPNLDTLEVLNRDYGEPGIERSFKPVELPRIRTLVVDAHTHYLVKCCVRVRVILYRGFDVNYLRSISLTAGHPGCVFLHLELYEVWVFSIILADVRFESMGRLGSALSQSQGTGDRPGQWIIGVGQHHSHMFKTDTALQLPTSRLHNRRSGFQETPPP